MISVLHFTIVNRTAQYSTEEPNTNGFWLASAWCPSLRNELLVIKAANDHSLAPFIACPFSKMRQMTIIFPPSCLVVIKSVRLRAVLCWCCLLRELEWTPPNWQLRVEEEHGVNEEQQSVQDHGTNNQVLYTKEKSTPNSCARSELEWWCLGSITWETLSRWWALLQIWLRQ